MSAKHSDGKTIRTFHGQNDVVLGSRTLNSDVPFDLTEETAPVVSAAAGSIAYLVIYVPGWPCRPIAVEIVVQQIIGWRITSAGNIPLIPNQMSRTPEILVPLPNGEIVRPWNSYTSSLDQRYSDLEDARARLLDDMQEHWDRVQRAERDFMQRNQGER